MNDPQDFVENLKTLLPDVVVMSKSNNEISLARKVAAHP